MCDRSAMLKGHCRDTTGTPAWTAVRMALHDGWAVFIRVDISPELCFKYRRPYQRGAEGACCTKPRASG